MRLCAILAATGMAALLAINARSDTQVPGIFGTGMAVINDLGDLRDGHPKRKAEVGRRLALWALNHTYGFTNLVCSGPIFIVEHSHSNGTGVTLGSAILMTGAI